MVRVVETSGGEWTVMTGAVLISRLLLDLLYEPPPTTANTTSTTRHRPKIVTPAITPASELPDPGVSNTIDRQ